jgi:hypothetical protein
VKIEAAFFRAKLFTALPFQKSLIARPSFLFSSSEKSHSRTCKISASNKEGAEKYCALAKGNFQLNTWQKNNLPADSPYLVLGEAQVASTKEQLDRMIADIVRGRERQTCRGFTPDRRGSSVWVAI